MRLMNLIVPFLVVWLAVRPCVGQANAHAHGEARSIHHGPIAYVADKVVDLGDVRQHERISGSFVIENHGNEELVIKSMSSHCGCTVVELDDKQKVIPPNAKQEVSVFFSSEDRQGRQRKQVTVITNDPEFPITMLTVKANVLASFRVEPSQLVPLFAVHRGDRLAPLEIFPTDQGATLENLEVEIQGGLLDYALESIVNDAGIAGVRMTMSVADEIELGEIDTRMLLRGTVDGTEQVVPVRVKGKVVGPIEVIPPRIESTHPTPRGRIFAPITLRPTDGRTFEVNGIVGTYVEGTHRPGKKPGDVEIVLKLRDDALDGAFGEDVMVVLNHPDVHTVKIPVFVNVRPRCRVEPRYLCFQRGAVNEVRRVSFQSDLVSALEIRDASCDNPSFAIEIVAPTGGSTKVRYVDVRWTGKNKDKDADSDNVHATLSVNTNVPGSETVKVSLIYCSP